MSPLHLQAATHRIAVAIRDFGESVQHGLTFLGISLIAAVALHHYMQAKNKEDT